MGWLVTKGISMVALGLGLGLVGWKCARETTHPEHGVGGGGSLGRAGGSRPYDRSTVQQNIVRQIQRLIVGVSVRRLRAKEASMSDIFMVR